jgi:hypothetical protein
METVFGGLVMVRDQRAPGEFPQPGFATLEIIAAAAVIAVSVAPVAA